MSTIQSKTASSVNAIQLSENHVVLFDIESPFGNINHIVIGRDNGVFLILKKSYRGKVELADDNFFINGKPPEKDFITEALQSTHWFEHKLRHKLGVKVQIMPIVTFTHTTVPPGIQVKGVSVICLNELIDILNRERPEQEACNALWENRDKLLVLSRRVKTPNVLAHP